MYPPYLAKDVIRSTILGFFGGVNPLGQRLENLYITGAIHFTAIFLRVPNWHGPRAEQASTGSDPVRPRIPADLCVGSQLSRA